MTTIQRTSLAEAIYQKMLEKETNELLSIWHKNDGVEWSDETFEIIYGILQDRLGSVPSQNSQPSKRNRRNKKAVIKRLQIPLVVKLSVIPLILIMVLALLIPIINPTPDDLWFTVLMFSLMALFFFLPGIYFAWHGWFKSEQTKNKIIQNMPKTKQTMGSFYRIYTLFLPERYVPSYFLLNIRLMSIVLIYGGVQMLVMMVQVL
jgi:hypothetical protein